MASHAVHWHEGMFLRPHYFRLRHRNLADLSRRNHKWNIRLQLGIAFHRSR